MLNIVKCIPSWQSKLKDTTDNQQWDFIVGYDLISEEDDLGHKTDDYAKAFLDDPDIQAHPVDFYFHDGESNWVEMTICCCGVRDGHTKRIGQGLNVYNFPALMERLKDEHICLEVCPISSNQMLRYIRIYGFILFRST